MGFLNQNLLFLLFLVPLLILLYILRLRRRIFVVPSSLLWANDIEDIKANTLFQKLRKNLLLPLQILILVTVIFALSRPFLKGSFVTAKDVIIIVDASASMKATDIGKSRFDALKSDAIALIENLNSGTEVTIIESGIAPKVVLGPISDKSMLKEALSKINSSDKRSDLNSAVKLALSLLSNINNAEIVLMSDGAGDLSKINSNIPIKFISYGNENANNVGIVDFDVIKSAINETEYQAFVSLKNFSKKTLSLTIELYYNDDIIDAKNLTIKPDERRPFVFNNINYSDGILKATINLSDNLSADNFAYYVFQDRKAMSILFVGESNHYIEKAIQSSSISIKLTRQRPENYSDTGNYLFAIFNRYVPEKFPNCNAIFFGTEADFPNIKLISKKDNPIILNWDKSHELLRFLDLSELRIRSIANFDVPSWIKPLIDTNISPAILFGENNGYKFIIVPFDLDIDSGSNFVLIPAFPIFMSNVLSFFTGSTNIQNRTGDIIDLRLDNPDNSKSVIINKPDASKVKVNLYNNNLIFSDTDQVGLYQISGDNINKTFSVNLLDESESDINPKKIIKSSNQDIQSTKISITEKKELWKYFILIVLMLLTIEWWVYHRRILV